jgi:hypothetical protein
MLDRFSASTDPAISQTWGCQKPSLNPVTSVYMTLRFWIFTLSGGNVEPGSILDEFVRHSRPPAGLMTILLFSSLHKIIR